MCNMYVTGEVKFFWSFFVLVIQYLRDAYQNGFRKEPCLSHRFFKLKNDLYFQPASVWLLPRVFMTLSLIVPSVQWTLVTSQERNAVHRRFSQHLAAGNQLFESHTVREAMQTLFIDDEKWILAFT